MRLIISEYPHVGVVFWCYGYAEMRSTAIFLEMLSAILNDAIPSMHYSDVIMSTMASQSTNLTIVYSTIQIKEHIKAPRHWPLWGEFTGDRWIPRRKGQ